MATINGTNGADILAGTGGNDGIFGYGGNDLIRGNGGADGIHGGNGADWIEGGSGEDSLFGGAGNDTLIGGAGNDKLWGDGGADRFEFHGGDTGADIIWHWEDGTDVIGLNVSGVNGMGALTITEWNPGGTDGAKIAWNGGSVVVYGADVDAVDFSASDFDFF